MKRFAAFGLIIMAFGCLNTNIKAQSALTIQKELLVTDNETLNKSIDSFIYQLIEATNGQVIYKCNSNHKAIVKGQMPIVLSDTSDDLAAQFNGWVNYQLTISCHKDKVVLTFANLYHHAKESINGFDFDYGLLKTNNATQKNAVYYNYDFLSEDYHRIHRFSEDEKISSLIHTVTMNEIDHLMALTDQ